MRIFTIILSIAFLSSCSVPHFLQKKEQEKIAEKNKKLQVLGDSSKQNKQTILGPEGILGKDIAIAVENTRLEEVLQIILQGWNIKIPSEIANIKIDAVVQSNAREAIFDILRQVKAQVIFYDKITPRPIAVIFAN